MPPCVEIMVFIIPCQPTYDSDQSLRILWFSQFFIKNTCCHVTQAIRCLYIVDYNIVHVLLFHGLYIEMTIVTISRNI